MSRLFLFIPGILQHPETVDGWADRAVVWVTNNTDYRADRYEYRSGALTRWWGQAARVRDLTSLCGYYAHQELTIVAHSNGCELACRMVRECDGVSVHAMHLFAAAADADFDKNGLNAAMMRGQVRRTYVYGSHHDRALWAGALSRTLFGWAGLGYGSLGRAGPVNVAPSILPVVQTVWRDEYDHSTWFNGNHFEETMRLATADLGIG